MIICIYWTTSGTSLNKTPGDYVVASHVLSKWSVTSAYIYAFSGSTRPSHCTSNQTNKIGLIWYEACDVEYSPLISSRPVFFVTWYMFKTVAQAFSRVTDKCCTNHLHFLLNKTPYINCSKQTVNEAYLDDTTFAKQWTQMLDKKTHKMMVYCPNLLYSKWFIYPISQL